jgi:hypothetical protein
MQIWIWYFWVFFFWSGIFQVIIGNDSDVFLESQFQESQGHNPFKNTHLFFHPYPPFILLSEPIGWNITSFQSEKLLFLSILAYILKVWFLYILVHDIYTRDFGNQKTFSSNKPNPCKWKSDCQDSSFFCIL